MPDDHSELVPLLPIPNRTVKRLSADDSAGSRVKVGHRQALQLEKPQPKRLGFLLCRTKKAPRPRQGAFLLPVSIGGAKQEIGQTTLKAGKSTK